MLSDVAAAPMEMTLLGIQGKVMHCKSHQAGMLCMPIPKLIAWSRLQLPAAAL